MEEEAAVVMVSGAVVEEGHLQLEVHLQPHLVE